MLKGKKVRLFKDRHTRTQSTMGAPITRKRSCLGVESYITSYHKCAPLPGPCVITCFSCAAMVFQYSKRTRTFFTKTVSSVVTLLDFLPCQTSICGVIHSCSYVLSTLLRVSPTLLVMDKLSYSFSRRFSPIFFSFFFQSLLSYSFFL